MWDNANALRQMANALFALCFLVVLYGALHYVVHLPIFPLRTLQLHAIPQRVDMAQMEAVARNTLRGNFFTADLEGLRSAFEKLPWVRKVNVQRHFPGGLEVGLEEHVALAQWNGSQWVNTYGEVFTTGDEQGLPESAQHLPRFFGDPDTAAEVTQMYAACSVLLSPLKQSIDQISLSPRRAWQLRLHDGMVLELGREQAREHLGRFVAVYPYSLAPLRRSGSNSHVDLRYHNGFAAYLSGSARSVDEAAVGGSTDLHGKV